MPEEMKYPKLLDKKQVVEWIEKGDYPKRFIACLSDENTLIMKRVS